jgi:SAM-dependent methyltransferase
MTGGELKRTFDQEPELYQQARPEYPPALFAELARQAGICSGARVLEIGPGTGQATLALAGLGARVTAVELGAGLARVLSERVAAAQAGDAAARIDVDVVVAGFEDWPLRAEPYDLVAAFTSWHWLTKGVRVAKSAAALRPGGWLATVTTEHVAGGTNEFFAAMQPCYERWDPSTPPGLQLVAADDIPAFVDEVDSSALFGPTVRRRFLQDVEYTTEEYLRVLQTYSGHRALAPDRLEGLLADLATLIDGRHNGRITKRYLYELRIAQRS